MVKNSVQRFNEIVKVFAFYGFGYIVDTKFNKVEKSPQNLRKAFEELGPTFVKLGQILSTRPDLVPSNYINELIKLQDRVLPEPFEVVNEVFFNEFKIKIEDAFLSFNKEALASASIAQVHKAKLKDGREVIVKIQRPDIIDKMRLDISILKKLVRLTKARLQDALINPEEALSELLEATELELDFHNEARNIIKFKELNKKVEFIYTPYLVEEFSSRKVITMEEIKGFKVTEMELLKNGEYDLEDLSKKLVLSFFKQVFEDNFFHADPHPGNILIREGKICYIDFGIMGNLSKSLKNALNDMMIAIVNMDINKLIAVLMSIGLKNGYINRNKLYEDIDYLLASYLSTSLNNIKMSAMLEEIFDVAKRNNIKLPKDLTLLIKSMVIIEGVVAKINPELNILEVAIPYVKANNKFSFFKELSFDEFLLRTYNFSKDLLRVPNKFIEVSDCIVNGRAKVEFNIKDLNRSINLLNKIANRLVLGIVISALVIGSSYILSSNAGPKMYGVSIIGVFGFGFAAFMGLWLIISILRSEKM